MMSVGEERYGFVAAFSAGIAAAALFELINAGRGSNSGRPVVLFLIDVVGIAGVALLLGCTLLIATTGAMRLYVFAGILLGMGFYRLTAGTVIEDMRKSRRRKLLLRVPQGVVAYWGQKCRQSGRKTDGGNE